MAEEEQANEYFKRLIESKFANLNDNNIPCEDFHIAASPGTVTVHPSNKPIIWLMDDNDSKTELVSYVGKEIIIRKFIKVARLSQLVVNYKKFEATMLPVIATMLQELRKMHKFGPEEYSIGKYYAEFKFEDGENYINKVNQEMVEIKLISNCRKVESL